MSLWRRMVAEAHRRSLWQVLGIYLVGSWIGFQVVLALVDGIGLPSWLPGFAAALFVIGLPIVLATAFVQEGLPGPQEQTAASLDPTLFPDAAAAPQGADPEPEPRLTRVLTWRRSLGAGLAAFAVLGVVTAGWLVLRALGIGPMASLLAAAELEANDRVLIAEFDPRGVDSTLAAVVTDAFRIDFSRSTVVRTVTVAQLQDVLRRMNVAERPRIDDVLAHQIAMREGIPVYVTGDVASAGNSYLVSARLIATASGEELAALRERARGEDDIIDAVDRLSRSLRERTGESLRTIRRAEPLAKVTTSSLEALQYYTQGVRASSWEGNPRRSMELHREALRHDSTFASAYRALGTHYTNGGEPDSAIAMLERALSYDDRQTERERLASAASYHMARAEYADAVRAIERLLEVEPDNVAALNNMGLALTGVHDLERANEFYRRSVAADTGRFFGYANLGESYVSRGMFAEAEQAYRDATLRAPQSAWPVVSLAQLPYIAGDIAEAETRLRRLIADPQSSRAIEQRAEERLQMVLRVQGRIREARERRMAAQVVSGADDDSRVWDALDRTVDELFLYERPREAARHLAGVKTALGATDDRDLLVDAGTLCGWLGDAACARSLLERAQSPLKPWTVPWVRFAHAAKARAEGDLAGALRILQEMRFANCHACAQPFIGRVFEEMEQPDSAAAAYERYVETPYMDRLYTDFLLAPLHERLGSYYEARGDVGAAARHYARFTELWQRADDELQPRVSAARQKLQRLQTDR